MAGILADVAQHTRLADHNRLELLLFRIDDGQRFGVDVCKVQEVVQCPPLTQVPESHPVVRGIAHIRGKTIPVLDLSMAIGGERVEANGSHYVVVAEFNRTTQGFLVHSVDRIVNMNRTRFMTPPPGIGNENYVTAVTDIDDELV